MQALEEQLQSARDLPSLEVFAKDKDRYSPHWTCAGVRSNELEGVAFMSSRNFTPGLTF